MRLDVWFSLSNTSRGGIFFESKRFTREGYERSGERREGPCGVECYLTTKHLFDIIHLEHQFASKGVFL